MKLLVAFSIAMLTLPAVASTSVSTEDQWRFKVLLDGKRVGHHRFLVRSDGAEREVRSEARFNVKVLFINAYRYAHDDHELWDRECLKRIDSRTDDNGIKRQVSGIRSLDRFAVATDNHTRELDSCVMTFAYWNPRILEATRLLNPQTGEYITIRVTHIGSESLATDSGARSAEHYRLIGDAVVGGKLQIDLWYSPDKDWLALESLTADGHRLRYQREFSAVQGARHASAE